MAKSSIHSITRGISINEMRNGFLHVKRETVISDERPKALLDNIQPSAGPTSFLERKGTIAGMSISIGAAITCLIVIIIVLTRRTRRLKIKAKIAAEAPETPSPVDLEKSNAGRISGTSPDTTSTNQSARARIQSLEEGMSNLVGDFLLSVRDREQSSHSRSSIIEPEDYRRNGDQGSDNERPPNHSGQNSRQNSSESPRVPLRRLYIIVPEGNEGDLVVPKVSTVEGRLSLSKSEGQHYWNAPLDSRPPSHNLNHIPQNQRYSTDSHARYPETPVSGYPPSAYPASTLPAYPDTIRSVSPPHYYDLSRTQTLRSTRSFRSAYHTRHRSRGDVPSLPSPNVQ